MALIQVGKPNVLKWLDEIEGVLGYKERKYIPFPYDKGLPGWVLTTDGADHPYWAPVGSGGGGGGIQTSLVLVIRYESERIVDNIDYGTTNTPASKILEAITNKDPMMFSCDYGNFLTYKPTKGNSVNGLEFYGTTYNSGFTYMQVSVTESSFVSGMYYYFNQSTEQYEIATEYDSNTTYYLKKQDITLSNDYLIHFDMPSGLSRINISITKKPESIT